MARILRLIVHKGGVYDMEYTIDRDEVPTLLRDIADQMDQGCAIDTDENDHVV